MESSAESTTAPLLSVVIPVYNECPTIDRIVRAVRGVDIDKEIIIVDDGSSDGTREKLATLEGEDGVTRVIRHERNQGKGAALRTGLGAVRGKYVIVQDADLEYDPGEYEKLLRPLIEDQADVVFGSRFAGRDSRRVLYFWHSIGNRALTLLSNMLTNLNLSDMETCFKVFRSEIIRGIEIRENRFGVEPEITAKLAKFRLDGRPLRIYEVGISYYGRTYEEGKKIGWQDGFRAMWCIFRYNLFD